MKFLFTLSFVLLCSNASFAEGFNLALTPDIAMVDKDTKIEGAVIGVWSENPQSAFALGFVNGSTGDSQGLSLAFIANYSDNYSGAQIGFVNYNKGSFFGFQWGAGNYTQKLKGLQLGLVNFAETADQGVQIGIINIIQQNPWFEEFPQSLALAFPIVNWKFN